MGPGNSLTMGAREQDVYHEWMLWQDKEFDASGQYEWMLYQTESGIRQKLREYGIVKGQKNRRKDKRRIDSEVIKGLP